MTAIDSNNNDTHPAPVGITLNFVLVARHYDIPYCGIAKSDDKFYILGKDANDEEDRFHVFELAANEAAALFSRLFPGNAAIADLVASNALVTPALFGNGVDDAFRKIWNEFIDLQFAIPKPSYFALLQDYCVSRIMVMANNNQFDVTAIKFSFLADTAERATRSKEALKMPLELDVSFDLEVRSEGHEEEF
jgi:hypothetical protein